MGLGQNKEAEKDLKKEKKEKSEKIKFKILNPVLKSSQNQKKPSSYYDSTNCPRWD